jgi:acetyl esterase/lipase
VRDVVFSTAHDSDGRPVELKMDCVFLKQSDGKPMPVVIYIHGGGWSGGDRAAGVPLSFPFAQGGYFACTVSYRLSGQATFPAQLHDVKAAVRFIRTNADRLGIDPDRIGVWGHSAGGHLSALLGTTGNVDGPVATLLDGPERSGAYSNSAVQAVVEISAPNDLVRAAPRGDGGPMIKALLGGAVQDRLDLAKQASPVNHVNAHDAPFLIVQGGRDQLVPDAQAEIMRDALKAAGVEVEYLHIEEAVHGVPDRRALIATAEFFDEHLGGNAAQAMTQAAQRLQSLRRGSDARLNYPDGRAARPDPTAPQSQPAAQPR